LVKKVKQAINNCYNGLRLSEDLSWLKKDWNSLIDYEEKLDAVIENHRIKALCTYSLNQFDITNIIGAAMNHQFALVKKGRKWEQMENPGLKRAEKKAIQTVKEIDTKSKEAQDNIEKLLEEKQVQLEEAYKSLKESERGLAEAQRIAHFGSWSWDIEANKIYGSDETYRIFGLSPQELEITYDGFLSRVFQEDRAFVDKSVKAALKGQPYNTYFRIVRTDSEEERTVHAQGEIVSEGNKPVQMLGIIQDITERKKAEKKIKENEEKLKTLFELLPVGVSITDKERNILDANIALEKIMGTSRSDLLKGTYGTRKYISSNGKEISAEGFPSLRALKEKGSIQSSEIGVIKEDGSVIWTDVTATSLPFSDGQVAIVTRDITESKKAAEKLQKAEEKYRIIAEQTGQLVYDYNVVENITEWAGNIKEITGYTPDKFINANLESFLSCIHPEDLNVFLKNFEWFMTYGGTYRSEYRFRKENGEYIYFEDHGVCLEDGKGMVKRILGAIKDITERKKAEQTLVNIETARKKEIHHRIKNNLQVISSLLDLQVEKFRSKGCAEDSDVLAAFRESQDRVLSIALIHEELHEGSGTDNLNFCPYLEKLVENLFKTYRVGNVDLSLNMDFEENIFFDMDVALPLGLTVNEIISNSLKYAFKDRDQGKIQIKLCREESGESISKVPGKKEDYKSKGTNFILTISDNGIGLPENFKIENSDSLGLQLISILINQLEGKLELKTDSGTEFVMKFVIPEKE